MPRFVILEHTGTPTYKPGRHWDLMLEWDGLLRTWELPAPPTMGLNSQAIRLPDHRLEYLGYEGPISDNRGSVRRWDAGEYQIFSQTELDLTIQFAGVRLQGRLHLTGNSSDSGSWQAYFTP